MHSQPQSDVSHGDDRVDALPQTADDLFPRLAPPLDSGLTEALRQALERIEDPLAFHTLSEKTAFSIVYGDEFSGNSADSSPKNLRVATGRSF